MPTTTDMAPGAERQRPARRWRRLWPALIVVVMLAIAAVTLRGRLPTIHEITVALRTGQLSWVLAAAGCEAVSLGMFARQQRSLLRALSVRMSMARALAVTYARSALAISMPAGSAVSAAFAFRQYRRSGASREQAAAVTVLSGLISFFGLAVLYTGGALALLLSAPSRTWHTHPTLVLTTAAGLVVGAAIGVAGYLGGKHRAATADAAAPATTTLPEASPDGVPGSGAVTVSGAPIRRWIAAIRAAARESVTAWRTLRPRHWAAAGAYAVTNWFTDLLCLAAASRAFGLPVGLLALAGIYLAVQIVRQIPLTPGGIGLIETGLLAGLTAAGATGAGAAAAVLTYRVLSCWLILPIGGLAALGLRRAPNPARRRVTPSL